MLADTVLVIVWTGVSLYGVFGGADFGGGIWDLFAGNAAKGSRPRSLVATVIGPVWEANHVWLIFVLVYLWTAFPDVFASIASTMYIPLTLAALGIISRGAGFAFRKWARTTQRARLFGAAFAGGSLLTPFFLGAVAGGVASGRVPLGNAAGDEWGAWFNPTSILGGALAVLACAFLAAVLLTREATVEADEEMTEYFRRRALFSGVAAGAVALIGIAVLRTDAPELFHGLTSGWGVAVIVLSAVSGVSALSLVWDRRYALARVAAVSATVSVLWGWAAAQYPDLLPRQASVSAFAASPAVLWSLIGAAVAAGIIVVPALVYLLTLTQQGRLAEAGAAAEGSTEALLERLRD